jgi:dTDP-4-dehydrorhamnose 3,5-epimerase
VSGAPAIEGIRVRALQPHDDDRGRFTELCRASWLDGPAPVQWNAVRSDAGVLRGVHWHDVHADYLTVVDGTLVLGLRDLRAGSPSEGTADVLVLTADEPAAVEIPPGVAHGFWFPEASIHVYAVSHYWDPADERGVRWDDPRLAIPWPAELRRPRLSPRDAALPALADAGSLPRYAPPRVPLASP